jgi:hypothetical protein
MENGRSPAEILARARAITATSREIVLVSAAIREASIQLRAQAARARAAYIDELKRFDLP